MSERDIDRCREYLENPGISIVKEAALAAATGKVSAMHDVTEGGLATALEELSTAGGHRMRVVSSYIPILPDTARVCALLGLNPLGLIGSGSLIICCPADASDEVVNSIRAAGIVAAVIGEVIEEGNGVQAVDRDGEEVPWPHFEVDELARLCSLANARQS
jgi:hydrogenase expression/formation protein HypE